MQESNPFPERESWRLVAALLAAHLIALRNSEMVPGEAIEDVLDTVESVKSGGGGAPSLRETVQEFEERVEAQVPRSAAGVVSLGRGMGESIATVSRLQTRDNLLNLAETNISVREAIIRFAESHVVTSMAATIHGQPASPTSLAHWLGGAISPISRAFANIGHAFETTNQSPLGSGSLAATRLTVDRDESAALLGFGAVLENTFDAVSAIDFLLESASAVESFVIPIQRLLGELAVWLRSDPTVLVFEEDGLVRFGDLPQLRLPTAIDEQRQTASTALDQVSLLRNWSRQTDYGPQIRIDTPLSMLSMAISFARELGSGLVALLTQDIDLNRAALANKAGKSHVTSSDLADFLMLEEQLAPADAQLIATRALAAIKERGQEISAVDKEVIDAAALLVIGREVGVEFESISRYLAPRRVLESRTSRGAPSPQSTRVWLKEEKQQTSLDRERLETMVETVQRAMKSLDLVAHHAGEARLMREN